MREETRCRHMGYSFRLTARVLLYAPSHRQDNTYHGLCYTSYAGGINHSRHFHNVLRHCSMSRRTFHNVVCNVRLLPRVKFVKSSSGLVVVVLIHIFPTPHVTHMPFYMFHMDSQRYSFQHGQSNPHPMTSLSYVACIVSTSFVIKV